MSHFSLIWHAEFKKSHDAISKKYKGFADVWCGVEWALTTNPVKFSDFFNKGEGFGVISTRKRPDVPALRIAYKLHPKYVEVFAMEIIQENG